MELGPLEMKVLGLLEAGRPVSVSQIRTKLGRKHAYTTVMTVLGRLHQKGVVVRTKDGNRFLYAPASRAPGVAQGIFSRMRRALFHGDGTQPLLALLDDESLTAAELRELRDAIDRKIGEKKR